MPRFRFQLQALLDFRIRKEDELKRRLGELENIMHAEQETLAELERSRQEAAARYEELESSDVDLERARLYRGFYRWLSSRIEDQQQVISELEDEMKIQRDRVVEAMRERKVVQSLRDSQFERFRLDELRREQAFLDDLATSRHVSTQLREDPETA
ncbi:MAG: flagellar export protein FliJ [Firmicutes bacterium]|nr:flagellar export protein FliJ [Bacillota bacterium]